MKFEEVQGERGLHGAQLGCLVTHEGSSLRLPPKSYMAGCGLQILPLGQTRILFAEPEEQSIDIPAGNTIRYLLPLDSGWHLTE